MITKPRVVKLPSPNFFTPSEMRVNKVEAVVMHGTASYGLQSALDWLRNPQHNNPDNRVSANFVISKSGVIYELVPFEPGFRSFANGKVENADLSLQWLSNAIKHKINPNWITVSIEHEATPEEMRNNARMTDLQFNSSVALTAYILTMANLLVSHETIIGHNQISGTKKRTCPGVIFPPAYSEVVILRNPTLDRKGNERNV